MFEVRKTDTFVEWLDNLSDFRARAKVLARIGRLAMGNLGDVKPVGEGVSELRIDYGPGYRVYFKQQVVGVGYSFGWWDKTHASKGHQTGLSLSS